MNAKRLLTVHFDDISNFDNQVDFDQILAQVVKTVVEIPHSGDLPLIVRAGIAGLNSFAGYCSKVEIKNGPLFGIARTETFDMAALNEVLCDFFDSISGQGYAPRTASPIPLSHNDIFAISILNPPADARRVLEEWLCGLPQWQGCIELDAGNPVHREVFFEHLSAAAALCDGEVYVPWYAGGLTEEHPPPCSIMLVDEGVAKKHDHYSEIFTWKFGGLSPRGEMTAALLSGIAYAPIEENILQYAAEHGLKMALPPGGRFQVKLDYRADVSTVQVPMEKLTEYSLNMDHPSGQHKAKVFLATLDLSAKDAPFLRGQLIHGIRNSRSFDLSHSDYGIKVSAEIPIVGNNGKVYKVQTGWIVRSGEPLSLVTAYIAANGEVDGSAHRPPVVWPRSDDPLANAQEVDNLARIHASHCVLRSPVSSAIRDRANLDQAHVVNPGQTHVIRLPIARSENIEKLIEEQSLMEIEGHLCRRCDSPMHSPFLCEMWRREYVDALLLNGEQRAVCYCVACR